MRAIDVNRPKYEELRSLSLQELAVQHVEGVF
jgi:hypothetical protein